MKKSRSCRKWGDIFLDCLWPRLTGQKSEQATPVQVELGFSEGLLKDSIERLDRIVAAEEQRKKSVDDRLLGLLAFAPLIVGLNITLLVFLKDLLKGHHFLMYSSLALNLYIALQMARMTMAAMEGLSRRNYNAQRATDIIPVKDEERAQYLRRQLEGRSSEFENNLEPTNEKVSQMALGHCALRNATGAGIILLTLFVFNATVISNQGDLDSIPHQFESINEKLGQLQRISSALQSIAASSQIGSAQEGFKADLAKITNRLRLVERKIDADSLKK